LRGDGVRSADGSVPAFEDASLISFNLYSGNVRR